MSDQVTYQSDQAGDAAAEIAASRWQALWFLIGLLGGVALLLPVSWLLSDGLRARTDLIGFPTYFDFDIRRYHHTYWLWLSGLTLATVLVGWLGALKVAPPCGWWRRPFWPELTGEVRSPARVPLSNGARMVLLVVAMLGPWLLYTLSALTHVTLADDGTVIAYPWFSGWLALGLSFAVGLIGWRWHAAMPALLFLGLGAPVIWLVTGGLPGALGPMDYFHEGEMLVPGWALLHGLLPWRDLHMIHGPWFDALRGALGQWLFEPSRWGGIAGVHAILNPLYFLGWFALFGWLLAAPDEACLDRVSCWFGRVLGALLALLAVACLDPFVHVRLMLYAPMLLALGWYLQGFETGAADRWGQTGRALLLVLAGLLLALGTPEAAFGPIAVALTLLARDLLPGLRHGGDRFAATRHAVIAAVPLGLLTVGLLYAGGMLPGLIQHLTLFSRDHDLAGGIPFGFDPKTRLVLVLLALVIAVTLAALLRSLWRCWSGAGMRARDWVLLAAALFMLMYGQKVVNRLDGHIFHVAAAAAPLIGWALVAVIRAVQRRLPRFAARWQPLVLVALLAVALSGPGWLAGQRAGMKARWKAPVPDLAIWYKLADWQPVVPHRPVWPKLGYASDTAEHEPQLAFWHDKLTELGLLDVAGNPAGQPVFDMTNRPGLFHYLLGQPWVGRYFHVSMALRRESMIEIAHDVDRDPPALAILPRHPGWDAIPDLVRHYLVTQAVLRDMMPFARTPGTVLFRPHDQVPAAAALDPAVLGNCDWRSAAAYLAPPAGADWQPLDVAQKQEVASVTITGWAVDPAVKRPADQVRILHDGQLFDIVVPARRRPDVVATLGKEQGYLFSGFDRRLVLPNGWFRGLSVEAVMRDGRIVPLTGDWRAEGVLDRMQVYGGRSLLEVPASTLAATVGPVPSANATPGGPWLKVEGLPPGARLSLAPAAGVDSELPLDLYFIKPGHLAAKWPVYLPLGSCPVLADGTGLNRRVMAGGLHLWDRDLRPLSGVRLSISR